MRHDESYFSQREAAAQAMGGVSAIYARLDNASDGEARTWLAARSPIEREVIIFLLSLRLPAPDTNADLAALLALDERVLYGRLKMATPEMRARFAAYLQMREECRTDDALLRLIASFDEPDAGQISAPDSV
ncbi:MAG TPA: hypothetical protein VNR70_14100 [Steroidobacteraceae bacterium]|nr:hypothetical protein [Steroidobacteraceae bacterium]